jgi:hypothetical protein
VVGIGSVWPVSRGSPRGCRSMPYPARPTEGSRWVQGNHGRFVYVAPGQNVVLIRLGTEYNYGRWPDLLAELARCL